jgi:hypothetical protein
MKGDLLEAFCLTFVNVCVTMPPVCCCAGSEDRGLVFQTDTDASVLTAIR